MKKFLVSIALLAGNISDLSACSFYPYGDEVRINIFSSMAAQYPGYRPFNYTSWHLYGGAEDMKDANASLWVSYCQNKISYDAAFNAIYEIKYEAVTPNSANTMVRYLFSINDIQAIEYLKFAKRIEDFNTTFDNPWEREDDGIVGSKRNMGIQLAEKAASQVKNNDAIKARYYFLALRLAYYNHNNVKATEIFEKYFSNRKSDDILNGWSLFFRAGVEKNPLLQSYYAALAFQKAADKRVPAMYLFHYDIPVEDILKLAKSDAEKAAILELKAMRKVDYALDELKKIYDLNPNSEALGFLLLREINKLEDWIYTPYYTYFNSVLRDGEPRTPQLLQRIAKDRQYAAKMLQFVNSINKKHTSNPETVTGIKAYLMFMTQDYAQCNQLTANELNDKKISTQLRRDLQHINMLSTIASQQKGSAILSTAFQDIITSAIENREFQFVFAVGRELEFLGNTTTAALLYSHIDGVPYKSKSQRTPFYFDYYYTWTDYLDGTYTPKQVQHIIDSYDNKANNAFNDWLYSKVKINELHNIVGTKYLRINDLNNALAAFKRVPKAMHTEPYLDENPFYKFKYTPDFVIRKDSVTLTKAGITAYLIKCITKARDINEKNADYYAFLAANCYYNMSQYGNSWFMRRYVWSSSELESDLPDNNEYFCNNLAKHYYLEAYRKAKNKKFKALCLRMAAHCEHDKLQYKLKNQDLNFEEYNKLISVNKYYYQLKNQYPDYVDDLYDGCYRYTEYFKGK